ncbi:hypothetical protein AFCDBAGC_1858 [Methylobacterium cerastii]|uniref:Uncharacterized protein n=1 Tax=Methylobacterium cerastii TaxID=932741 RepID=A0ABQ4QFG9_9HYPH|nr:hypothetical protein AFCDBAGC_1858 [Methylobacterium cerastii]
MQFFFSIPLYGEENFSMLHESFALASRTDTSCASIEQSTPYLKFKVAYPLRDCGLTDA